MTTPTTPAPSAVWQALGVRSGVAADGSTLYALTAKEGSAYLTALDAGTGTQRWAAALGEGGRAFPAVRADGSVLVGTYDDRLHAFSPDGTLLWSTRLDGDLYASPAVLEGGDAVVATAGGSLYRIGTDGTPVWRARLGAASYSSPAVGLGGTVYVGTQAGELRAYSPDGALLWLYQAGRSVFSSPALDAAGNIYFGSADGYLYALDTAGNLRWKAELGGFVNAPPVVDGGKVVIGSSSGRVAAFDLSGAPLWARDVGAGIAAPATLLAGGSALVGDLGGTLHHIAADGSAHSYALGGRIDLPVTVLGGSEHGQATWLATADGTLYALAGVEAAAAGPWATFRAGTNGQGRLTPELIAATGTTQEAAPALLASGPLSSNLPRLIGGRLHLPLGALAEAYGWELVPPTQTDEGETGTLTLERGSVKGEAPERLAVRYTSSGAQPYAALSDLSRIKGAKLEVAPTAVTLTLGGQTRVWALDWLALYGR